MPNNFMYNRNNLKIRPMKQILMTASVLFMFSCTQHKEWDYSKMTINDTDIYDVDFTIEVTDKIFTRKDNKTGEIVTYFINHTLVKENGEIMYLLQDNFDAARVIFLSKAQDSLTVGFDSEGTVLLEKHK